MAEDTRALLRADIEQQEADILDNTFGPNTCTGLTLMSNEGDQFSVACGKKRCTQCGMRKKYYLAMILKALGSHVWIGRVAPEHVESTQSYDRINRRMAAMKKQAQRKGLDHRYVIVGDPTLGWIIASTQQVLTDQRLMETRTWQDRILDVYHHSVNRIRKSLSLGSMSLPRISSNRDSRDKRQWRAKTYDNLMHEEVKDLDWSQLFAELSYKYDDLVAEEIVAIVKELQHGEQLKL